MPEYYFKEGYSWPSTILAFGLDAKDRQLLQECIDHFVANDKVLKRSTPLRIYDAEDLSDIYAIPCFMAFINCQQIIEEDLLGLMQFWAECREPWPEDLLEEYSSYEFAIPATYLINCPPSNTPEIPGIKINKNIFADRENLRLTVLSELKDNEGLGRKAGESSIRISRVLLMYKCLLREGSISKQRIDDLCYPDTVSPRMFLRDIALIKAIEDHELIFDPKLKAHVFKKQDQ